MQVKKAFFLIFLLLIFISGCEMMRASQSKDFSLSDAAKMVNGGGESGPEAKEPITVSSQLHKFNEWLKENLW